MPQQNQKSTKPTRELTERQNEIYKLIKDFVKKNGYPCSQVYLAKELKMGTSAMFQHVNVLVHKRVVRKTPDGGCLPL